MSFVFAEELDRSSLQQGDVLKRTDGLEAILSEVHPHYLKPDYRFFIVLTQSCDLVRRGGTECKAPYISIAAVRPCSLAVERYAERLLRNDTEVRLRVASNDRRAKVQQFVERLLNNNEPEYFYLHGSQGSPVQSEHCAFLQLSIALKSRLHYDTLLAAKILQLKDSFQHKLGYLVGTSYSRVGTEDWVPKHISQARFDKMVKDHVDAVDLMWLDRKLYDKAVKQIRKLPAAEQTIEALERAIEKVSKEREQKKQEVLESVVRVATDAGVATNVAQKLALRLGNDPVFMRNL